MRLGRFHELRPQNKALMSSSRRRECSEKDAGQEDCGQYGLPWRDRSGLMGHSRGWRSDKGGGCKRRQVSGSTYFIPCSPE